MNENYADITRSARIMSALRRQMFLADGRTHAFVFAAECKGDLSQIEAEIRRVELLIAEGLEMNPHGSYSPGASPRLYNDGYLVGLREAVEIVRTFDIIENQ